MRKAEDALPKLADKIALYVGLHCLGVFTYHFHEQILHKIGVDRAKVRTFRHRDKTWRGWPCDMRLTDVHGNVYDVDADNSRLLPRTWFTNWRCLLCFDKANEFSDVSCGDCRIRSEHDRLARDEGYDKRRGLSEIVVRTDRARRIVDAMAREGRFRLYPVSADAVAASIGVAGKKLGLNTFSRVARLFHVGVPDYRVRYRLPGSSNLRYRRLRELWAVVASAHYYVVFVLSRYRVFRWILKRIPHRLLGFVSRKREKYVDWARFASAARLEMMCDCDAHRLGGTP
jgi:hypothetical protein